MNSVDLRISLTWNQCWVCVSSMLLKRPTIVHALQPPAARARLSSAAGAMHHNPLECAPLQHAAAVLLNPPFLSFLSHLISWQAAVWSARLQAGNRSHLYTAWTQLQLRTASLLSSCSFCLCVPDWSGVQMERVETDTLDAAVVWQAVRQPAMRAGRTRHVGPVAPFISLFRRASLSDPWMLLSCGFYCISSCADALLMICVNCKCQVSITGRKFREEEGVCSYFLTVITVLVSIIDLKVQPTVVRGL